MSNIYIGNPLDVIKEYSERKEYRSLATITDKECHVILSLALDNGDWKGHGINHIHVETRYSNFVEGNISFGDGKTYYFSIRYDGTVHVHEMEFSENKTEFIHGKKHLKTYRFSDITFFMMKCGFDLLTHLK